MICAKRTQSVLSILLALALTIGFVSCKKEEDKKKDEKKEEKTEAVVEWTTELDNGVWVIQGEGTLGKKGDKFVALHFKDDKVLGEITIKDKKATATGDLFKDKTLEDGSKMDAKDLIIKIKDNNLTFKKDGDNYYADSQEIEDEAKKKEALELEPFKDKADKVYSFKYVAKKK